MNAIHHIVTQQCINISSSYVKSTAPRCTQFALLGLEGLGTAGQMVACRMVPWFACCSSSSPTLIIESFFPKFSSEPAKRFNYDKLAFSDKNLLCPVTRGQRLLVKAASSVIPPCKDGLKLFEKYSSRGHGNARRIVELIRLTPVFLLGYISRKMGRYQTFITGTCPFNS